jgi:Chaperone of endosialidase
MKTLHTTFLFAICGIAAGWDAAYATQPPDPVSSDGAFNTAMGTNALENLTTLGGGGSSEGLSVGVQNPSSDDGFVGVGNTASGRDALLSNTSGSFNTASGYQALSSNTTGTYNTAIGVASLYSNNGNFNTAAGAGALNANTSGNSNTGLGQNALLANTTGNDNTANGYQALDHNTSGDYNTASGFESLQANTIGNGNTASGYNALLHNRAGGNNTASGRQALSSNIQGSYNIAEGYQAGSKLTTGSYNIEIGNVGVAAEHDTIRIGTQNTQTQTFIAGIYENSGVSGLTVVVDSNGQLGTSSASSERFKTAVLPMGLSTSKLEQLRPVSFRLKSDPTGPTRYGLIAEEVAMVYPELVVRGQGGRVDGVRYEELAPMLLNEMQKDHAALREARALIESQARQLMETNLLVKRLAAQLDSTLVTQRSAAGSN